MEPSMQQQQQQQGRQRSVWSWFFPPTLGAASDCKSKEKLKCTTINTSHINMLRATEHTLNLVCETSGNYALSTNAAMTRIQQVKQQQTEMEPANN